MLAGISPVNFLTRYPLLDWILLVFSSSSFLVLCASNEILNFPWIL